MLNKNKPLLLRPSGKDYPWGGSRLNDVFKKNIDLSPLAETWECSTHPDGPSYVTGGEFDGKELAEVLKVHPEYLGIRYTGKKGLPILIKFIDTKKDLSVQVHPTDQYAREKENGQLGKNEMWYVLEADPDAKVIYGLNRNMTREELHQAVQDNTVMDCLQQVPVHKGDVFFIPAGTIHAIGAGALVAEIQESSNLTYRLYDYNRVGKDGKMRKLHIEKALDVASLHRSEKPVQPLKIMHYQPGGGQEPLVSCKYFEVSLLFIDTTKQKAVHYCTDELTFQVLLCTEGKGIITFEGGEIPFHKGNCIFIPADSVAMAIRGQAEFLAIRG